MARVKYAVAGSPLAHSLSPLLFGLVVSNLEKFGKKIGGDILEKKKTLLYLFTYSKLESEKKLEFENIFNSNEIEQSQKINSIKSFYETSGALEYLKNKVRAYLNEAEILIDKLELDNDTKKKLNLFCKTLLNREI